MVLYGIKLFVLFTGAMLIFVEELRRPNIINKKLLIFALLLFIKDAVSYVMLNYYGESILSSNFFFYYIAFWIPTGFFYYTVLEYFTDKKRNFRITGILFGVMVIASAMIYQFQPYLGGYFRFSLIAIRMIYTAAVIWIIVCINMAYVGVRSNFFMRHVPPLNVILTFLIVNFLTYNLPDSIFHGVVETMTYGSITFFFFMKNQDGYQEMFKIIDDSKKELTSIMNLMNKSGVGSGASYDFDEITNSILSYIADMVNARSAILLVVSADKKYLVPKAFFGVFPAIDGTGNYASIKKQYLETYNRQVRIKIGEMYLGRAAQIGEPVFYQDAKQDEELREQSTIVDITSMMVLPLVFQEEVMGLMAFCNKEDGTLFENSEYNLAKALSSHVAIIINNFKFYNQLVKRQRDERELEIAGSIQKNLMPRVIPEYDTVDIFTYSRPAKGVGGDYYNIIQVDQNRIDVVIADVAGKGVPASLVMVMISTVLKNIIKSNYGPKRIISFLNKFLCKESTLERYATLSYLSLDVVRDIALYTNSGHSPLLLYKALHNKFEQVDTPGIPLGIDADQQYYQKQTELDSGDIMMMFTDGVTEAMNDVSEMFGLERLRSSILENKNGTAEEIGNALLEQIEIFAAGNEQHDDLTLIIVKKR
ncbi:MAG: SpoIIE family protein phosphatase [Spirochaetes bacterium]|jgi:sigma-B regulation protein RsbU (phosphoserine phosphatase)|nr:SpoIIE family protein phosphatase [Spirochaetota bacterium]